MNAIEQTASQALTHLQLARREMGKLICASHDEINHVVLTEQFNELESDCREFLRTRFFIQNTQSEG